MVVRGPSKDCGHSRARCACLQLSASWLRVAAQVTVISQAGLLTASVHNRLRRLGHGEQMVRGKCLFSGLVIQCFFNGMLLVGLGTHDEYAAEAEQDYHVSHPLHLACTAMAVLMSHLYIQYRLRSTLQAQKVIYADDA